MQAKKIQRPIHLYWGGRRPCDLYLNDLCQAWEKEISDFKYIPVISDALAEEGDWFFSERDYQYASEFIE